MTDAASRCRYCTAAGQSGVDLCASEVCQARDRNEPHRAQYRRGWNEFVATQHHGAEAHGAEVVAAERMMGTRPVVGIVPYLTRALQPVPQARRRAFLAHLESIVEEAFAGPVRPPPVTRTRSEAPELAIGTAACIACQGHCCVLGMAANAFLTAETIAARRHRDPDVTPDRIVAHYTRHIPDQHVRDSCVFQGAVGCTLDRAWRADMCNAFQCNGKRQALKRLGDGDAILWVAHADGRGRVMLHDAAGTRLVETTNSDHDAAATEAALAALSADLPQPIAEAPVTTDAACRLCGSLLPAGHEGATCGGAACALADQSCTLRSQTDATDPLCSSKDA